jgi:hypothetical protein
MKASMIVAALLSTVAALPAANNTDNVEVVEVAALSPAEIQELAAKTVASIKLVQEGNANPQEVAEAVKESLNSLNSFTSSLNRGEAGSMWPSFTDFTKSFGWEASKAGLQHPSHHGGHHEGFKGWCHPRADDVDDMDNDLDGDCDDDDGVAGVLGLLLEAVAETLDQLIPGLDDVVEELTDDLGTNDKNTHKVHNPDHVKGKGPHKEKGKGGKAHVAGGSW